MHDLQRCMNCGAGLKGPWCHVCGQRDDDYRRPFLALGNEFIGDVFAFDSRIFRSVPPFLFAPGMLTRSFMKGKRGKYVSPLRLYFVLTLIFFAVLAATDVTILKIRVDAARLEQLGELMVKDEGAANLRFSDEGIELGIGEADDTAAEGAPPRAADVRKAARERAKTLKEEIKSAAATDADGAGAQGGRAVAGDLERRMHKGVWPDDFPVHIAFFSRIEEDENFDGLPAGWKEDIARKIDESNSPEEEKKRMRRYYAAVELALTNPRAFNQIFNTWIPRILIIVVPLFALLTSWLYGRHKRLPRRIYYVDHLVFSIYFHSFIFFVMLLLVLKAEWIGNVWSGSLTAQIFFLTIAAYLFVGMKQAFGQGWFKTSLKFVFLSFVYFITLASTVFSLLVVGVLSLPVAA